MLIIFGKLFSGILFQIIIIRIIILYRITRFTLYLIIQIIKRKRETLVTKKGMEKLYRRFNYFIKNNIIAKM